MTDIELGKLTKGEIRNLTGHERGLHAREMFNLDVLDAEIGPVTVIVPDDLDAITSSFFQGMFARSVQSLEPDGFLSHYKFQARPLIKRQIQRGIDRVRTRRGKALAG